MMERRPNQVYANEATQTAISGGATRICVTSPCGGGKTLMMVDQLEAALEQNKLASLHTLRRMLFDQTAKVLESQGINFGKRASGHETALLRDIQLAMTQTELSKVYRNGDRELHKADIALWDEAHIQKSPATEQIMADYIAAGGVNVGYTATPLDIGNLYDELIVAGTPSELRKTGALVPVIMYGPDEPDLTHIKNYTVGDDLTEAQNVKVMIRPGVYGRVIDHYRRLNPEQLPAVGFAPGVKYSIGFAEKFTEAGIRAAHIDGNDVWLDGEFHPSSPETREMVMEMSRTGEIKILWNRYVLRVGVDAPWLQHGILACVFGSLTSYLQTAGRLARSCEGKPHAILQDHGGNWWRHGSVNADRDWSLDLTNRIAVGERKEKLREKTEQEPIVCQNCGMIRKTGKECPGCGHIAHVKSRMVVQIKGDLKPVVGDIYKPRVVKDKPDTQKVWERYYYSQKRAGRTFNQAYAWFWHEEHYWPPKTLPLMPRDLRDWFRCIGDVPRENLQ